MVMMTMTMGTGMMATAMMMMMMATTTTTTATTKRLKRGDGGTSHLTGPERCGQPDQHPCCFERMLAVT